nr:RdgB/HAM1 family non-canonical purine NTP pyrophosphatase [Lachnospiraceae bacterium]
MKQLILATHNPNKVREIRQLLAGEPVEVLSLSDAGWTEEIAENGETFEENALIKALTVFKATGRAVLADDSGLTVEAMGGAPGVYSARYMGEGIPYSVKNQAIIDLLARVPEKGRGAAFECVMAFVRPDKKGRPVRKTAHGKVEGRIAYEPAGGGGFGYDPIFFLPEKNCTMAELSAADKNIISHRGRALRAILPEIVKWSRN